MIIAADARLLMSNANPSSQDMQWTGQDNPDLVLACIQLLASQKKEHRFFIISDNINPNPGTFPSNVEFISYGSTGTNGLFRKFLPGLKLAGILKKIKADVLIFFDEIRSSSVPQVLVLSESKKINERTAKKAAVIAVNSEWQKNHLEKKQKTTAGKIETLPAWVREIYKPLTEEEKRKIKEKYSSGKEYFLFAAKKNSDRSFINLLKSFSHFKKRQQSNIKLVLLSKPGDEIFKLLSTYKYRNDVFITEKHSDAEEAALTGAAYAVIIPQDDQQPVLNTLKALQCAVPLIATENTAVKEIAGEAALYIKDDDKEIGEKMISLYTDEALRNKIINQGKIIAAGFTKQKATDSLWLCISKAVK